jgi:hypothetical protein
MRRVLMALAVAGMVLTGCSLPLFTYIAELSGIRRRTFPSDVMQHPVFGPVYVVLIGGLLVSAVTYSLLNRYGKRQNPPDSND